MAQCLECGVEIPEERLAILKEKGWPMHCVKCSKVQAPAVFMIYSHKTAGEVMIVPNNPDGTRNEELVRQAERAYRRSR